MSPALLSSALLLSLGGLLALRSRLVTAPSSAPAPPGTPILLPTPVPPTAPIIRPSLGSEVREGDIALVRPTGILSFVDKPTKPDMTPGVFVLKMIVEGVTPEEISGHLFGFADERGTFDKPGTLETKAFEGLSAVRALRSAVTGIERA